MIKRILYAGIMLMLCSHAFSQSVGKYKFKGKEYLVFPYRIGNTGDIPMLGYVIPDGEYLAFATYNFKEKLGFRREKKHVLTDTTIVAALFSIKANQVQGPAVFYNYSYGNRGKQRHKPSEEISGNFVNGLKNGEWKRVYPGKYLNEIKTYKDGVADGYLMSYDKDGLEKKEKYCAGVVCDTVFYYLGGTLWKEHDLIPPGSYQVQNCYSEALSKLDIRFRAKTYCRQYDYNGKLLYDIKLKDGAVLPFDSMRSAYRGTAANNDYVTLKKTNEGQLLCEFHDFRTYSTATTKEYFENDFLVKRSYVSYNKIRKKKWFLGKRKVTGIDTVTSEEIYVNPKTLADTILRPVQIYKEVKSKYVYEKYYIPGYRFIFYQIGTRPAFIGLDTARKRIYINSYRTGFRAHYYKRYEQIYLSADEQLRLDGQTRAFLNKAFIVPDVMEHFEKRRQRYSYNAEGYDTREFVSIDTKPVYYKDSVLLNGMYLFSPSSAKPKNIPSHITYTGYTNIEEDTHLGQFVNGVKEGQWLNLYYSRFLKKAPLNLKAWFFAHPKTADNYEEENYKQGMRDGLCVYYEKYDPKRRDRSSKKPIILYKSKELNYLRDTLNGICKIYFPSGKLMREVNMVMGTPDGEFKSYFEDGTPNISAQFKKGKLDGPCLSYNWGGLYSYAYFKDNCVKDSLIYYFQNGRPSMAIYTRYDTLVKKISYYHDGKVKEVIEFDAGSRAMIVKDVLSSESFIETLKNAYNNVFAEANARYKNYYDNGQLLSEGPIRKGKLNGPWKFYSLNGVLIHDVDFADTTIRLPGRDEPSTIAGSYKGYYINGKQRCTGYIKYLGLSYDCFTKQDKADLDFYVLDFYDMQGKQTLKNGNGYFIKYDENGSQRSAGKLKNCAEDSLWRYYTPEQKLTQIGHYVNDEKEGVWYEGSLEGINFEDGACFDMSDPEAIKEFNAKRKELSIIKTIYRNGVSLETSEFYSDLNKTYDPDNDIRGLEY